MILSLTEGHGMLESKNLCAKLLPKLLMDLDGTGHADEALGLMNLLFI